MTEDSPNDERTDDSSREGVDRRSVLGAAGAGLGLSVVGLPGLSGTAQGRIIPPESNRLDSTYSLRDSLDTDLLQGTSLPSHPDNGDAEAYSDKRASYIKGLTLQHGRPDLGLVDQSAWDSMVAALDSGVPSDFDDIQTGGNRELVSPQAGLRTEVSGLDPQQGEMPAAPSFTSDRMAAEMAETYWMALLRDVAFKNYLTFEPLDTPTGQDAADDLSGFSEFTGPKNSNGNVTVDTLFRAGLPGCLTGPYVSQLLWRPVSYGAITLDRRINEVDTTDYNTTYSKWLEVVEGTAERGGEFPPRSAVTENGLQANSNLTGDQVYIRNGRDLGEYVHINFSYQPYLTAALLIHNDLGSPVDPQIPFQNQGTQTPYISVGGAGIFDMVANVAAHALSAAWFHKWLVHLRLRPETFAGRVHNHMNGTANYGISTELTQDSSVLAEIADHNDSGSYLLPAAYPEGSPAHPSYPSGHAVIAGACTTVLKTVFDETHVIQDPVEATADGTALESIDAELTLGGELNKLAANVTLGRNFGGVHYRSDGIEGMLLGEQVAHNYMEYVLEKLNQPPTDLSYESFAGGTQIVNPGYETH